MVPSKKKVDRRWHIKGTNIERVQDYETEWTHNELTFSMDIWDCCVHSIMQKLHVLFQRYCITICITIIHSLYPNVCSVTTTNPYIHLLNSWKLCSFVLNCNVEMRLKIWKYISKQWSELPRFTVCLSVCLPVCLKSRDVCSKSQWHQWPKHSLLKNILL